MCVCVFSSYSGESFPLLKLFFLLATVNNHTSLLKLHLLFYSLALACSSILTLSHASWVKMFPQVFLFVCFSSFLFTFIYGVYLFTWCHLPGALFSLPILTLVLWTEVLPLFISSFCNFFCLFIFSRFIFYQLDDDSFLPVKQKN